VTLPDFWATLHGTNLKVIRDNIDAVKGNDICLRSGQILQADTVVLCTGWGDHFGMFDNETKAHVGLPIYGDAKTEPPHHPLADEIDWEAYDLEADKAVNEKLPFPKLKFTARIDAGKQSRWRLYNRAIPVNLAREGDRSLAILGQIHTVQTPLVSEVQSFWAILYLLGYIDMPDVDTMAREVALWNAWTRKRYLSQGQKFPYSLYEFLPVFSSYLFVVLPFAWLTCHLAVHRHTFQRSGS
jgi:hypothetical protein